MKGLAKDDVQKVMIRQQNSVGIVLSNSCSTINKEGLLVFCSS